MNNRPDHPQPRCGICSDWGTVLPRNGGKPIPCTEPGCRAGREAAKANAR